MNLQKKIILGFLLLLLLTFTILIIYRGNNTCLKKPLTNFSEIIELGKVEDLSLTIYYIDPFILTAIPLSVDDIIKGFYKYKVIVSGRGLEEHIDLLNQISNDVLIPVEHDSYINARIYYVFETKKNRKIFDVTLWGSNNNIFVNGIEVKENNIFYEIVIPFLPEDAAKQLERYANKRKQE